MWPAARVCCAAADLTTGPESGTIQKQCTKCLSIRPLCDFRLRVRRSGVPRPRSWCRPCERVDALEAHRRNPQRSSANHRAWAARNAEHLSAYAKTRRIQHRAQESLRRSRIRKVTVERVDLRLVLQRDGYTCHICSGTVRPTELHFDHVIPISRGGSHSIENIRVSHAHCNQRKGARLVSEMAA